MCVRAEDWYGVWGAWLEWRVGMRNVQEWKQHWVMVKRRTQHFSSWGMQSQRQEKRRLNWDTLFSLLWDKEHIWVSPNEVDEPRAYHTEWSKSEREKQILYIHTHTRNLERWYWWTYLQGDTDIDNRLEGTGGQGEREVAQSCLNLCVPMDCSLPGPSVHGILQARILD